MGRGVSLCRNAGMISCGGVRGETHAVTARHLKRSAQHPTPLRLVLSFFLCSLYLSSVSAFTLYMTMSPHLTSPLALSQTMTLNHPLCFGLYIKLACLLSVSPCFYSSLYKFFGSVSGHRPARCIKYFWPRCV